MQAATTSAARFLDKLVRDAPFEVTAVQVEGRLEFMADFETACDDRGIKIAVLPLKTPEMKGYVSYCAPFGRSVYSSGVLV